jgi:hypothetical protein
LHPSLALPRSSIAETVGTSKEKAGYWEGGGRRREKGDELGKLAKT